MPIWKSLSRAINSSFLVGETLSVLQKRFLHTPGMVTGKPAFVFDIDGVLIRGNTVLDSARKALQRLYTEGGKSCGECIEVPSAFADHAE